eukprot:3025825-Alexandrium_andersonii.AAC.1
MRLRSRQAHRATRPCTLLGIGGSRGPPQLQCLRARRSRRAAPKQSGTRLPPVPREVHGCAAL